MRVHVQRSCLFGGIGVPASKSVTQRALLFGAFGCGKTIVYHPLRSPDTEAMMKALRQFGALFTQDEDVICIEGNGTQIPQKSYCIDAQNSGIVLRFCFGLCALSEKSSILYGDQSIMTQRIILDSIGSYQALGCHVFSCLNYGYAPVYIKGPIRYTKTSIMGQDSQFVSSLLIAGAFSKTPLEISVREPGEKPFVAMTLSWFDRLKIPYVNDGYVYFKTTPISPYRGFSYVVPGDLSSAAFLLVAALITQSDICMKNCMLDPNQGDKKIFDIVEKMGAHLRYDEKEACIFVKGRQQLQGIAIDVNDCIDCLPILAVLGCFAKGTTVLYNGSIASTKESNRIESMFQELSKMGASMQKTADGLVITHSSLSGATVFSHTDHRVAMALIVAGMGSSGVTTVEGIECIEKSFPFFIEKFLAIGACLKKG